VAGGEETRCGVWYRMCVLRAEREATKARRAVQAMGVVDTRKQTTPDRNGIEGTEERAGEGRHERSGTTRGGEPQPSDPTL
jgi:hypothetical protein